MGLAHPVSGGYTHSDKFCSVGVLLDKFGSELTLERAKEGERDRDRAREIVFVCVYVRVCVCVCVCVFVCVSVCL